MYMIGKKVVRNWCTHKLMDYASMWLVSMTLLLEIEGVALIMILCMKAVICIKKMLH